MVFDERALPPAGQAACGLVVTPEAESGVMKPAQLIVTPVWPTPSLPNGSDFNCTQNAGVYSRPRYTAPAAALLSCT